MYGITLFICVHYYLQETPSFLGNVLPDIELLAYGIVPSAFMYKIC